MTGAWRDRLLLFGPVVGVFLLAFVAPSDDGPTICPFALFTGMACPGCGMTRAVSQFVRGDLAAALDYHPVVPIIIAQAVVGWIWLLLRRTEKVRPLSQLALNVILIGTAGILLSVWVARLTSGTLPPV